MRLDRPIELGHREVVSALHRDHVSGLRLYREKRALHLRDLLKPDKNRALAHLFGTDQNHVALRERPRDRLRRGPCELIRLDLGAHGTNHHGSGFSLVVHARHDGFVELARFEKLRLGAKARDLHRLCRSEAAIRHQQLELKFP